MKKIYILATGGTISGAGAGGRTAGYRDGAFDIQALIAAARGIDELAQLEGEQVLNISSDDITMRDWQMLARRVHALAADPEIDGIVLTHGTNTMEETAFFLNLTTGTEKPVVLTGSMRPATANSADGSQNLYEAVALAASDEAIGKGVLVAFSDGIFSADRVQKVNCLRPEGFGGRDAGCIGYLQDDRVIFFQEPVRRYAKALPFSVGEEDLPRVEIVYFYADADPQLLQAASKGADGLVIAGAGKGLMSKAWKALMHEIAARIPVVRSTRVGNGMVPREAIDEELGTIAGCLLPPVKARILLSLAVRNGYSNAKMQELFEQF